MIQEFKSLLPLSLLLASSLSAAPLEIFPPNEARDTAKIVQLTSTQVREAMTSTAHRDAHVKAHGCVRADFQVLADIPESLKVGVFKDPKSYPAWIRYSNSSGKSQKDSDKDARGMAIKLMNVPGLKILEDENTAQTQDFLMINHNRFIVKDANDYVSFMSAVTSGNVFSFFFPGFNPANWRLQEFGIANDIQSNVVLNPLDVRYWSTTPYLLGTRAIKFSVTPCHSSLHLAASSSPDFMGENIRKHLKNHSACFDFKVQVQGNPKSMPVEDPRVEWSEAESPFIKVGTITIPQQQLTGTNHKEFCENLSFTPWHSLPEHRPLGGINRVRKEVYRTISELRHELNKEKRLEPTPESF